MQLRGPSVVVSIFLTCSHPIWGQENRGRDEESDRSTKEQAIGYAQVRACFRSGEIRIVDNRHYLKHSSGL